MDWLCQWERRKGSFPLTGREQPRRLELRWLRAVLGRVSEPGVVPWGCVSGTGRVGRGSQAAQTRAGEQQKPSPASAAGPGKDAGPVSSISPSLGDISSQLLLPPRLSMSGGGGDLLLECFGSGSPSNVRAVTTGKVPKEALLNRSWLGACCFQALP